MSILDFPEIGQHPGGHQCESSIAMNLGDVYIKTFLVIGTAAALLAAMLSSAMYLVSRHTVKSWCLQFGIMAWLLLLALGNVLFHKTLFSALHKSQNTIVPNTSCLYYEPTATTLHAAYTLDCYELEKWIKKHPWGLREAPDSYVLPTDELRFGISSPDRKFETKMSPSGQQLRVYYQKGIAYVSYSSM